LSFGGKKEDAEIYGKLSESYAQLYLALNNKSSSDVPKGMNLATLITEGEKILSNNSFGKGEQKGKEHLKKCVESALMGARMHDNEIVRESLARAISLAK
jgi:hypothetical protein